MDGKQSFKLYTDGGARGNPGPAAIGVVLVDCSGNIIKQFNRFIGKATNNQAEYTAIIEGLRVAKIYWKGSLACYSDSELLVRQVNGEYSVRNEELKGFYATVKALIKGFPSVTFTHVRREDGMQSIADRLVNEALDEHQDGI